MEMGKGLIGALAVMPKPMENEEGSIHDTMGVAASQELIDAVKSGDATRTWECIEALHKHCDSEYEDD